MNTATLDAADARTPAADTAARDDAALFRRITWRLMPLLCACYVLNYLDRTNVGYAQLQMKEQLGFSDAVVRGLVKAHLARVESAERLRDPFADTPPSPPPSPLTPDG